MILCFKLSMPNVGSWNGKWTGESNLYVIVRNFGKTKKGTIKAKGLLNRKTPQFASQPESGHYYYNFGDGWGAGVDVYPVDAKEAGRLRRKSNGFCGYEWMVDSIVDYGGIYTDEQRRFNPQTEQ